MKKALFPIGFLVLMAAACSPATDEKATSAPSPDLGTPVLGNEPPTLGTIEVELLEVSLDPGDQLSIGIHPTSEPYRVSVEDVRGDLLSCPVDSTGIDSGRPSKTNCTTIGPMGLESPTLSMHIAIGMRTLSGVKAKAVRISYVPFDGHFVVIYRGSPRVITLVGPTGNDGRVDNVGRSTVVVNAERLKRGAGIDNVVATDKDPLVIEHLGERRTEVLIDWYGERSKS